MVDSGTASFLTTSGSYQWEKCLENAGAGAVVTEDRLVLDNRGNDERPALQPSSSAGLWMLVGGTREQNLGWVPWLDAKDFPHKY